MQSPRENGPGVLGRQGNSCSLVLLFLRFYTVGKTTTIHLCVYIYSYYHSDEDELKVKEETGATIRCFPFEQPEEIKTCLMTGNSAKEVAIFAKSY